MCFSMRIGLDSILLLLNCAGLSFSLTSGVFIMSVSGDLLCKLLTRIHRRMASGNLLHTCCNKLNTFLNQAEW
jgi:hypothetical protein